VISDCSRLKGVGKSDQGLRWQAGAGARGRAAGVGGETRVWGKRRDEEGGVGGRHQLER